MTIPSDLSIPALLELHLDVTLLEEGGRCPEVAKTMRAAIEKRILELDEGRLEEVA